MEINLSYHGRDYLEYWAMVAYAARVSRLVHICVRTFDFISIDISNVDGAIVLAELSSQTASPIKKENTILACTKAFDLIETIGIKKTACKDYKKAACYDSAIAATISAVNAVLSADEQVLNWFEPNSEFKGLNNLPGSYIEMLIDRTNAITGEQSKRPFVGDFCERAVKAASAAKMFYGIGRSLKEEKNISEQMRNDYSKLIEAYSIESNNNIDLSKVFPTTFWGSSKRENTETSLIGKLFRKIIH